MKPVLEFAALLIAFLCFSTALKAFLRLRHHEWRLSQKPEQRNGKVDQLGKPLDKVA